MVKFRRDYEGLAYGFNVGCERRGVKPDCQVGWRVGGGIYLGRDRWWHCFCAGEAGGVVRRETQEPEGGRQWE